MTYSVFFSIHIISVHESFNPYPVAYIIARYREKYCMQNSGCPCAYITIMTTTLSCSVADVVKSQRRIIEFHAAYSNTHFRHYAFPTRLTHTHSWVRCTTERSNHYDDDDDDDYDDDELLSS